MVVRLIFWCLGHVKIITPFSAVWEVGGNPPLKQMYLVTSYTLAVLTVDVADMNTGMFMFSLQRMVRIRGS